MPDIAAGSRRRGRLNNAGRYHPITAIRMRVSHCRDSAFAYDAGAISEPARDIRSSRPVPLTTRRGLMDERLDGMTTRHAAEHSAIASGGPVDRPRAGDGRLSSQSAASVELEDGQRWRVFNIVWRRAVRPPHHALAVIGASTSAGARAREGRSGHWRLRARHEPAAPAAAPRAYAAEIEPTTGWPGSTPRRWRPPQPDSPARTLSHCIALIRGRSRLDADEARGSSPGNALEWRRIGLERSRCGAALSRRMARRRLHRAA